MLILSACHVMKQGTSETHAAELHIYKNWQSTGWTGDFKTLPSVDISSNEPINPYQDGCLLYARCKTKKQSLLGRVHSNTAWHHSKINGAAPVSKPHRIEILVCSFAKFFDA